MLIENGAPGEINRDAGVIEMHLDKEAGGHG